MRNITLKFSLLLLLCTSVFILPVFARKGSADLVPLAAALKKISSFYQVNFLYEELNIANKKITFSEETLKGKNIENLLTDILSPAGLKWTKIDAKNYAILPIGGKVQSLKTLNQSSAQGISNDTTGYSRVSGKLTDQHGKGVEFSTMALLKTADSSTVKRVLTDTSGAYSFSEVAAGEYFIKASSIGYKTAASAKFNVDGKLVFNVQPIVVQSLPQTLNEVRITSAKQVVEAKNDRFIFNVANSAMASGNSIQLLKSAPFVKVSVDNTVTLQGKKTMILIDNKPVPESSVESFLQTLPAGNISQIELITHPSAKYDAAYGSVINIITKKSKIEGFTGTVGADGSVGTYENGNLNTSLTYKYKKLTLYGNGGFNRGYNLFDVKADRIVTHNQETEIMGNNWRRLSSNRMYSFQAGGDFELTNNQTIGLAVNGAISHFEGPWTTVNSFSKQGGPIDSVMHTNATFEQPVTTYNYNLNYHLITDSGKNELTILTNFTPFKRDLYQYFPSVLYNSIGEVINTPAPYQSRNKAAINIYTAQADYTHNFNGQLKFEGGIKYQYTSSHNTIDYELYKNGHFENVADYSSDNEFTEALSGAYGILSKDWKMDKLQAGIRVENTRAIFAGNFNQQYFNIFPTFLYQHNINDQNNVSFAFKRTITRTPYYELIPYSVFLNRYTLEQGNPALKPAYDNVFSANATFNKVNISLSYTSTKGMFALFPFKQDFDTQLTYFSRQNLDKAYDYSMYLYFPLRITSWWESQNSGSPVGYNKAQGKVLGADYALAAFHSDFKSTHIFQLSKRLKLEINAYYWTNYVQDLSKYSGYKNIDAGLLFTIWNGKGQLRLAGNELVFKRNEYHLDRDFGGYSSRDVINTDSRRISAGFSYKFGKTTIKSSDKKLGNEEAMKRLN